MADFSIGRYTPDPRKMAPIISSSIERIEAPVTVKAYAMCAFAAFAGVLFGYDSGYISGVLGMDSFKRDYGHPSTTDPSGFSYETWEKSLIVSILSLGTFCGALISGWLADSIGRRPTLIGPGCGVFMAGVVVQMSAQHVAGLCIGRFVAGLGVGCVSAVNILYMSEVAPRKVRGAIVSAYQFAITIGLMLASCVGYATRDQDNSVAYRIPIGIQFLWALILSIGLFLLPESPRYYVKMGRYDKAVRALARVRGQPVSSPYIEDELSEIVANYQYEQQVGEVSWLGVFGGGITNSNSNMRKIFIGTALQMMQQWTGINFIFYYNVTFFQSVHLDNAFLISMITTVVNVASTPLSFYAIEKFGRRSLLIYGAIMMCICEFTIAIVGVSAPDSDAVNYCLITFVCLYIAAFACTWGPSAWVVIGEIFQLPIRSKGVALSTASNWFWNCIIGIITPFIVDRDKGNLGVKVFFIWGTTCAFCAVFAYVFVPESKGLTLEQVDKMMEQVPAYRSKAYRPQDTFADTYGYGPKATATRPSTSFSSREASMGTPTTVESFIEMHR
ncbi:Putative major facilitator, sugar transporter, major facilitator superfamily [Septoria linicola]|uniref:Major facilitator, sugar transporter, major facilitator superfamily n=1 Tax=Septoria linicola TaxID=215465 RepID=A0A9Q9EHB1_9PEZI|nr:putative major facilitator, sugar transporter, major facilitator superfamily [Septoria linicola]USW49712.1 Putative major facilitator, sugar transporter, major facilitator superfamily [Septoria linicola]